MTATMTARSLEWIKSGQVQRRVQLRVELTDGPRSAVSKIFTLEFGSDVFPWAPRGWLNTICGKSTRPPGRWATRIGYDIPLVIFLDLNVPLTPELPIDQKPWFDDLNRVFDLTEKKTGDDELTDWPLVIASNSGQHFDFQGGSRSLPELGCIRSKNARNPFPRALAQELLEAVRRYGIVPEEA